MNDRDNNKPSPEFLSYLRKHVGEQVVVQDHQVVPTRDGQPMRMGMGGTLLEVFDDGIAFRAEAGEVFMHFGTYHTIVFPSRITTGAVKLS